MRILGIDPGFGITGWSILDVSSSPTLAAAGIIKTNVNEVHALRLSRLRRECVALLSSYKPDAVSIEKLFFAKNITTAMKVSEARGVLLATMAEHTLSIYEYTPMQVKQAITGYGNATKRQVIDMLRHHLPGSVLPSQDDAADAVAIALTHATNHATLTRITSPASSINVILEPDAKHTDIEDLSSREIPDPIVAHAPSVGNDVDY